MTPFSPRLRRLFFILAYIAFVVAVPYVMGATLSGSAYATALQIAILTGYFAIAATGLNIIVGYCGLLNLGYGGFMLVGGYTAAILMKQFEWSFWAASAAAIAHGAFWGVLLGLPTLRLTGDYFAIVTLCFGELVNLFARNWVGLTRGSSGYHGVPRPAIDLTWLSSLGLPADSWRWAFSISSAHKFYYWYLVAALLGVCLFVVSRLSRSRMGRAWRAMREDETAAEACGVYLMWYKTLAFAISAGIGALAGAFYTGFRTQADFGSYNFMISISVLAYLVLGGMGTVMGPVLGALVLVALGELLRQSPLAYLANIMEWWPAAADWLRGIPWVADMRMILYGLILILMIRFRPQGLLPSRSLSRELHGDKHNAADGNQLFSLK